MLPEGEATAELIGDREHEFTRRVTSHFLAFLPEMGLVIVIIVKLVFEEVVGQPLGPFSVKLLKSENPC